jgi:glucose uptake protein GlcU
MAALAWVMMGIALWHFAVFLPDRFAGGIVGAFLGAALGAFLFGLVVHAFDVPGNDEMTLLTAFEAIPGALLGMGVVYLLGLRGERQAATRTA